MIAKLLSNFRNTVILSVALSLVMVFAYFQHAGGSNAAFWEALFRWMHTFFGILWIGLLYYFNFVQIRKMPDIPAELKPAVSKYIAPEALFWFRWSALATWVMGVVLAWSKGVLVPAFTLDAGNGFQNTSQVLLGIGMWLATVMFINVWGFIWPNQKVALGLVEVPGEAEAVAAAKAKAGRTAMLFSRTNLLLSIPMLTAMTMTQTIG